MTAIHSVAGILAPDRPLVTRPPFSDPHTRRRWCRWSAAAAGACGRERQAWRIWACCSWTRRQNSPRRCSTHSASRSNMARSSSLVLRRPRCSRPAFFSCWRPTRASAGTTAPEAARASAARTLCAGTDFGSPVRCGTGSTCAAWSSHRRWRAWMAPMPAANRARSSRIGWRRHVIGNGGGSREHLGGSTARYRVPFFAVTSARRPARWDRCRSASARNDHRSWRRPGLARGVDPCRSSWPSGPDSAECGRGSRDPTGNTEMTAACSPDERAARAALSALVEPGTLAAVRVARHVRAEGPASALALIRTGAEHLDPELRMSRRAPDVDGAHELAHGLRWAQGFSAPAMLNGRSAWTSSTSLSRPAHARARRRSACGSGAPGICCRHHSLGRRCGITRSDRVRPAGGGRTCSRPGDRRLDHRLGSRLRNRRGGPPRHPGGWRHHRRRACLRSRHRIPERACGPPASDSRRGRRRKRAAAGLTSVEASIPGAEPAHRSDDSRHGRRRGGDSLRCTEHRRLGAGRRPRRIGNARTGDVGAVGGLPRSGARAPPPWSRTRVK